MLRLLSLALFFGIWSIGSSLAGAQMLPSPGAVLTSIFSEARSGTLFVALGATLVRVVLSFSLAMVAGTALGLLMGRVKWADAVGDPWLVVVLNLPALVIIVLAYVWGGLTEAAAIAAVANSTMSPWLGDFQMSLANTVTRETAVAAVPAMKASSAV